MLPILDFGDVIYKIASNTLLSKLDVVYHSAIRFVTKAQYNTHHCNLYALVGWPSLHIRRQTHWLQVIYKSLLGKAPPYLSSLVTIATPTRSTRSSRYISLVIHKANTSFVHLSLLPMTGTNCKNHWSSRLISPSLTLSIYLGRLQHPPRGSCCQGIAWQLERRFGHESENGSLCYSKDPELSCIFCTMQWYGQQPRYAFTTYRSALLITGQRIYTFFVIERQA